MKSADVEMLTPAQVGKLAGVDPRTVSKWADQGLIPVTRLRSGHRRFRRSDVEEFMSPRRPAGGPTHRVISWDHREQISFDKLGDAIWHLTSGRIKLTEVDTDSDQYAIVLADRAMDAEEAYLAYEAAYLT